MAKTQSNSHVVTPARLRSRRSQAAARRLPVLQKRFFPAYVVWELTLACDHACRHCGSRAVRPRERELSTAEALGVVAELAALGTREVVLIGGEAYLHPGFLAVVGALDTAGITPVLTTGGAGVDAELAAKMKAAGLARASVSIDGLERRHDQMRAKKGSFAQATAALAHLGAAGIDCAANTNLNRHNLSDLEGLYEHLKGAGIRSWQVQLTAPLGRAADSPEMLLQPYDLLDLMPRVAALKERAWRDGILLMPGNNLGFFGPEELRLRSQRPEDGDAFGGCQAGRLVMGIESDGGIKGCPSLPTTPYVGGRVSDGASIEKLWKDASALAFTRGKPALWGHCATCDFSEVCRGGCNFTAHAFFGRPGNNPYCHFRALRLKRQGLRERLVRTEPAPGTPFDHGRFVLVEEAFDAPEPAMDGALWGPLVQLRRGPDRVRI